MKSPLKDKINTVFIPVQDVKKAKEWYSNILGVEGEIMHGHLCVLKMRETGVILDEMPAWRKEDETFSPFQYPAVQFATDDIQAAYKFMKENGVELVSDIKHGHFFVFKDPDGNKLMVCK